jgi:hypothetical protein
MLHGISIQRLTFLSVVLGKLGKGDDLPIFVTAVVVYNKKERIARRRMICFKFFSAEQEKFHSSSIQSAERQLHFQGAYVA